jgi:tetratricopeptide (TPR) repeat protein
LDADLAETTPPDALMRRALDHYRLALIKHPDHPEAPRIHFEIANMHVLLGEDSEAIELYARLQTLYPTYTDVDLALYRMGHAYSRLDDQPSAVRTWSRLLDQYPDSHLAPAVYFELARAFRNSGDLEKSHLALRHLVEGMRSKLSPRLLVSTAWLLCEGQDFERAAIAFRKALLESQEGEVAEEALAGLAQAEFGLQRWENLSKTLKDFHKRFPESRYAADLQLLLAREHRELGDPFTAVLALHRARELNPSEDILAQCDWIEGEIYAAAGLHSRALPLLFQAGQATTAEVSVPALRTHAKLALKRGYFEKARNSYERLAKFPLQRVPAQIGLAHVARSQRNYRQALVIIEETLALTVDRAERQQLLNLASEVIRTSPAVLNKPEDLSDDS